MLISSVERALFLKLYISLLGYSAGRLGGIAGIRDVGTFKVATNDSRIEVRDGFLSNMHFLNDFVEENPFGFGSEELAIVTKWHYYVQGEFFVERDLKKHTILLQTGDSNKAYGVLGICEEVVDMVGRPLPRIVKAVLLPWKGRIIWDGLFNLYGFILGGGIKRGLRDSYREAKGAGIITCLDPGWKPEKPKPAKKAKTPAISRFLKKCPKSVAEFREKYGKPRWRVTGEGPGTYCLWSVDGEACISSDELLLYANIIRGLVLYVYAKEGAITHVSVVDPTDWDRDDFRPYGGRRLMS